jgi:hypothetical protein
MRIKPDNGFNNQVSIESGIDWLNATRCSLSIELLMFRGQLTQAPAGADSVKKLPPPFLQA